MICRMLIAGLTLGVLIHCAAAPQSRGGSATGGAPQKYTAEETNWLKTGLSDNLVESSLKNWAKQLLSGKDGEPLSAAEIKLYSQRVKRWTQYYFVEHDTKISRAWLTGCGKYIEALGSARAKIRELETNRKTDQPEYRKWTSYYQQTAKQFSQIVQKPAKISDRELLSALGREKQAVLTALAEQEKGESRGRRK